VFPHDQRELVLAHAVLTDNAMQTGVFNEGLSLRTRGCGSFASFFVGGLGTAGCEGCGGAETDALGEDDTGVVA